MFAHRLRIALRGIEDHNTVPLGSSEIDIFQSRATACNPLQGMSRLEKWCIDACTRTYDNALKRTHFAENLLPGPAITGSALHAMRPELLLEDGMDRINKKHLHQNAIARKLGSILCATNCATEK